MRKLIYELQCESHPDAYLIEDYRAGDLICSQCGLVVGERMIDVDAEWRSFADDDGIDRSRVGEAENSMTGGQVQSTRIAALPGVGADGQPSFVKRLVETPVEKKNRLAKEEIKEMAERLSLDLSVIARAQEIYMKVQRDKLIARKSNALIAACVFVACRQEEVSRTFKEIVTVSNAKKTTIAKHFNTIRASVQAEVLAPKANSCSPIDLLARFCSLLGLPKATLRLAEQITQNALKLDIMLGRSPISVAAAAIMLAANMTNHPRTPIEIKEASGAAESTIKLIYNLLLPKLNSLVPAQYQSKPEAPTVKRLARTKPASVKH